MSFGTAIVVIVMIIFIYAAWHRKTELESERRRMEMLPQESEKRDGDQRELAELRERIKVLERIATENNTLDVRDTRRIAAEIEALRDARGEQRAD